MNNMTNDALTPDALTSGLAEAVRYARHQGADAVEIMAGNDSGFVVTARLGEVETVERHQQRSIDVTVYRGNARGSASTNTLRADAIHKTIQAALDIARHTAEDECAGLADACLMAHDYPHLDLEHRWNIDIDTALAQAIECEAIARDDKRIANSEGAGVTSLCSQVAYANSHGFIGAYCGTRHSISCSVVAADENGMQRDYWYSVHRNPDHLEPVEAIGRAARQRALRRLAARSVKTCQAPVLFEPAMARSLLGHFFAAISGGALYRQASFLVNTLNKKIFPDWLSIREEPHMPAALASAPFDNEGVRTRPRDIVKDGILQGYVLSSYAARKLGLQTTSNAGGIHNIQVHCGHHSRQDLIKSIGRGLLVTELIGHGVNTVSGDYSRGASGLWIEHGAIQYPVEEITIAGNLADMFLNIQAVGNDTDQRAGIQCGSILVDNMTIAGA